MLGPHLVRLRPAPEAAARVLEYSLRVSPEPDSLRWQQDPQANWVARILFDGRHPELRFDVDLAVDMTPINPFDFLVEPSAEGWPLVYAPDLWEELSGMMVAEPLGPRLEAFLEPYRRGGSDTLSTLTNLNRDVQRRVQYTEREYGAVQSPEDSLRLASGSCRDSAWLLVQALRNLGCAARFVSGYLLPIALHGQSVTPGVAGAELHAWASVFVPGVGWLGLDPTSGTLCSEAHLPLASVVHHSNASPVRGTSEFAGAVEFGFEVGG